MPGLFPMTPTGKQASALTAPAEARASCPCAFAHVIHLSEMLPLAPTSQGQDPGQSFHRASLQILMLTFLFLALSTFVVVPNKQFSP